jgi:hypothetical protein
MTKQTKVFNLTSASKIMRRHRENMQLPGLIEASNVFVSQSDGALTIRPDIKTRNKNVNSLQGDIQGDDDNDFLNSVIEARDSQQLVWLSRRSTAWAELGGTGALHGEYTTGTATGSQYDTVVTGGGTSWLQNIWAGCIFKDDAEDELYPITAVNSDTEIEIAAPLGAAMAGGAYTIYLTHNYDRALWPLHGEDYTDYYLYHSTKPTAPVEKEKLMPVLYSDVNVESNFARMTDITPPYLSSLMSDNDKDDGGFTSCASHVSSGTHIDVCLVGTAGQAQDVMPIVCSMHKPKDSTTIDEDSWRVIDLSATTGTLNDVISLGAGNGFFAVGNKWNAGTKIPWVCQIGAYGTVTTRGDDLPDDHDLIAASYDGTNYVIALLDTQSTPVEIDIYSTTNIITGNYTLQDTVTCETVDFDLIYDSDSTKHYFAYNSDSAGGTGTVRAATAADVTTWANEYTEAGEIYLALGTDSGGLLVASNTHDVLTSDGAGTWTKTADAFSVPDTLWCFGNVAHDGTRFFGIATDQTTEGLGYNVGVAYSTDGTTWDSEYDNPFGGYPTDNFPASGNLVGHSGDGSRYKGETHVAGASLNHYFFANTFSDSSNALSPRVYYTNIIAPDSSDVSFDPFAVLTTDYRQQDFAVVDGYVALFGVLAWDTDHWDWYPRRMVTTAPGTYATFSGTGSVTVDFPGRGWLLASRAVNNRIVVFESNKISSVAPPAILGDPWTYDTLADETHAASNPVVVDDYVYWIDAETGLIYYSNGLAVRPFESGFDLTKFSDFEDGSVVWLGYSGALRSLLVFSPIETGVNKLHVVGIPGGEVTTWNLPSVTDDDGTTTLYPKSVTVIKGATDDRILIGYNADSADEARLLFAEVRTSQVTTGVDTAKIADNTRFYADIVTPELRLTSEGRRAVVHEVMVLTNYDGGSARPHIAAQIKSTEDDEWRELGDAVGTITVGTSTCTGSGTCWGSDTTFSTGTKIADGDDVEDAFTTPCLAAQARIYTKEGATYTAASVTATDTKEVTFATTPTSVQEVFCFWENTPVIRVYDDDFFETDEGMHRITSVDTATTATLDWYPSAEGTGAHVPGAAGCSGKQ